MIDAYLERRKSGEMAAAIRPEILAAKLAAIKNLEYPNLAQQIEQNPQLIELLWFTQAMSMAPGGLDRFTQQFLGQFPHMIGMESLRNLGRPRFGKYNLEQCLTLWKAAPRSRLNQRFGSAFEEWREMIDWKNEGDAGSIRKNSIEVRNLFGYGMRKFNYRFFWEACRVHAVENLPAYLASLCNEISQPFNAPWSFAELFHALWTAMRMHAALVAKNLAMTAVAKKVFYELDFAWTEKGVVQLFGDSRFGKTESVVTWTRMHPGRARLVHVPPSNSETDFLRAIADALGINYTHATGRNELKDKVQYVARHGGLMFIFDESYRLFPATFGENTPPQRLEWVRSNLIDNGNACVFVTTPQAHRTAFNKFVRKTKYAIEQWTGRVAVTVALPNDLDFADLVAVAKIHFPEIDHDFLALIAAKAMQSESYLKAVEDIAKRSRYVARTESRDKISLEDIEKAIRDVLPAATHAARGAKSPPVSGAERDGKCETDVMQTPRGPVAKHLVEPFAPKKIYPTTTPQEAPAALIEAGREALFVSA